MRGLKIEGVAEDQWHGIVHGLDLTLQRGEVLGLIGESGAGKSTVGLAAMGYARPGCQISGGTVLFDGIDLTAASEDEKRKLRGVRIAYVAQKCCGILQSGAQAYRAIQRDAGRAQRFVEKATPRPTPSICSAACNCPTPTLSALAIRIRSRAVSCSAP